jgi:predicted permease
MRTRPTLADLAHGWRRRLRQLLRRDTVDGQMSAELAFHLDMETEKNIRDGMDAASARRAAVLSFGGVDRFSEEVRDVRNVGWLEDLTHDLRHTVRGLRRAPGFTLSAVAALSLGIGANTAVFSVVHAVVIARLPYAEPDRLVRVWETNPAQGIDQGPVSPGTFVDLRDRSRTLTSLAMFGERNMLFTTETETWEARAAAISPAAFEMLGVRPVLGTGFASEQPGVKWTGSYKEFVISHALWQRRFGGDPNIIGKSLRMDYRWTYTIAGVMPPGFSFPAGTDVWTPLTYGPTVARIERQFRYYGAIAKLAPGLTLDDARRETAALATQFESEHPASNAGWTVSLASLDRSIVGTTRPALLVILGLAVCVLLIACGNVATLAVARATTRRHEIAVRIALGAGWRRLARQWATEASVIAVLGGAGGLLVGYWTNRVLLAVAPTDIPRLDEVTFGGAALAFVLAATTLVALVVGLAPALRSRTARPLDAMRSRTTTGLGSSRSREWLVGAQVALTLVLTVAAALLLRSFERLQGTDLGFRRHDVLSAEVRVPAGRFSNERPWYQRIQYFDQLIAELEMLPGVRSVGGTSNVPLTGEIGEGSMWRTDAPGASGRQPPTSATDQWKAAIQLVTPRYFETVGIPLLRGRTFTATDRFSAESFTDPDLPRPVGVAIINEAMARRYWPTSDPLGSTIFIFDDQSNAAYRTVVGVIADARAASVDSAAEPTVFLPFAQNSGRSLSLVLRSSLPPDQLVAPVTDRLRKFDPAISIAAVRPFEQVYGGALSRPRFNTMLVGSFAALALVIAGVGVFGIVGFLVARRTPEIGIRVALGARPANVLWLVLSEGLRPVLLGGIVGLVGALMVARAMRTLLYELAPVDPVSFVSSAAVLLIASIVAAAVPARRATTIDPLRSLRSE